MSDIKNSNAIKRFLKYVKIDTQSDENSGLHPSTEKQKDLGKILFAELEELGAEDIYYDEEHNYIYAMIPATEGREDDKVLGFISHMDTSPETGGKDVNPQFVYDYDGKDIILNEKENIILSVSKFPELKDYIGKTLITTDGTTLLGADDKAGIAEIMSMAEEFLNDIKENTGKYSHGKIAIAFTPDEEIGEGTMFFDVERFGADYAYTVDGGALGELEYENFNAAAASVKVSGLTVHPGEAKDKMLNAIRVAEEFDLSIPQNERPEYTDGYEGFFYLMKFSGTTEEAHMEYIIRDHDRIKFEQKKDILIKTAERLNEKYRLLKEDAISVELRDQYFNMKEKIDPDNLFLIEDAKNAMKKLSIIPKISPIRGGTDGASLSFKGLPCPNLCAGGHNFHGKYEYVCAESICSITELLIEISTGRRN
ncbi:peptidase T [Eubacterium ruminantium]|uniref:peptidase T n=1 Tax=Eubacterium ruminantium TaxID=42322 RepID=UPI0024783C98|nr:peptidase T [Eubacterium ruminantium]